MKLCLPGKVHTPKAAPVEAIDDESLKNLDLRGRTSVTIGRNPDNDIVFGHPMVSRSHARILKRKATADHVIEDLGSTNGTFVNGKRVIQSRLLHLDDIINIGPYKLIYTPDELKAADETRCLQLDACNLKKIVDRGNKNLLQGISLSVKPREFVAIVGMSGSGKSTLLDALNGFRPASEGQVLLNGNDLYTNYDAYRNQLGYVPQRNIVHMGLTAYEVLDYSARLRLPMDTTQDERHKRVTEVLGALGISQCKDHKVGVLAGGEQRRVAMGVELLPKPGLFFLDEVTTGLDPRTEKQIMILLKRLSREGHTILLITHATKNVMECDKVIFLAKGGYLAYYGPPQESLNYFSVKDFDEIYDKLQGSPPEKWAGKYLEYKKYHPELQTGHIPVVKKGSSTKGTADTGAKHKRISSWNQFLTLSNRNLKILMHDRVSLILMLMIAPLIGMLDFIFWRPGIFDTEGGDPTRAIINLYMAAIVCFLVGGLASMREIAKEMDIYRRERMVCLKILPYALSKLWVAILISLYSASIFTLFMIFSGHWPPVSQLLAVYVTLLLSILAGMVTGLFISSLSPNQNVTPLILLIFLVPQVLFGGIMPEKYSGGVGHVLGTLTTTKWTFQSLVTISDMGVCVSDEQCRLEKCSGTNMFTECNFPGIADFKPASNDSSNENSANAIITANQSISNIKDQYGSAFNVNIAFTWCVLLMFIAGFFGLILAVLKFKDSK